ncbi:hypothetical protein [Pseudokineococcus lusitanus]|uniref:Uncharacterized protein n=1 Tax=Pseudokineococcus lusitanus TaxID=763993 RepID=A0A3N1HU80_9ACTN|nr:hypothetical protein [Pseudokineococcus lusitanus]ROP45977.1 hypothetical protein EDC03_0593 [Pseudokineococcus lusitanus]
MSAPLRVGDMATLDGDGMSDARAEQLVDLGFDFHEVARVSTLGDLADGDVLVRLDRGAGRPLRVLERELRAYRP